MGQVMVLLLPPSPSLLSSHSRQHMAPETLSLQAAPASRGCAPNTHLSVWWFSPSTQMKTACESLESGSLPLSPGPQPKCDAPSPPIYWPLSPALGNCPSLLHTQLDFIKEISLPEGMFMEIMSNQAGTPDILSQVPTLFVPWTHWQLSKNVQ